MKHFFFMIFLAAVTNAQSLRAEDLRSLPTKTKLTSAVSYSVLANSICLVMTPSEYKHGFDPDECVSLFHQDSVDTCMLHYSKSDDERAINGFLILSLMETNSFLYPRYYAGARGYKTYDPTGITAFTTTNLSESSRFQMACRSAGGKKSLDMADLRKVLAPYFDLEIPRARDF